MAGGKERGVEEMGKGKENGDISNNEYSKNKVTNLSMGQL